MPLLRGVLSRKSKGSIGRFPHAMKTKPPASVSTSSKPRGNAQSRQRMFLALWPDDHVRHRLEARAIAPRPDQIEPAAADVEVDAAEPDLPRMELDADGVATGRLAGSADHRDFV